jgi:hypothetical protein
VTGCGKRQQHRSLALQYEIRFSDGQSEYIVLKRYKDSETQDNAENPFCAAADLWGL